MYLLDPGLKKRWKNYAWQSAVATASILVIMLALTQLSNIVITAAAGATAFTVFAIPKRYTARPRNVIGGHLIGACVGLLCSQINPIVLGGSVAVGLAMLLMVITNTEHPPAAGTALGLVIAPTLGAAGFIIGSACIFSLIKHTLDPWMIDLTE